ncbi:MAG: choice-of-anchor O protein [Burkholderiaceae bacterium]|nr:choice-of-anchor O protein [Burkholderiaceae bacterium]
MSTNTRIARGCAVVAAGAAFAALYGCGGGGGDSPVLPPYDAMSVSGPFALSDFDSGDKPKIQRGGDGTLVVAYGDAPDNARLVYDVKAQAERPARDVYVRTCKPDATRSCDLKSDWSAPINVSRSSDKTSVATAWRGSIEPGLRAYPGDIDKANIKTSGPVMVLTWVGKYCPDGDPATAGEQPPVQRAIRYVERSDRVIPFSCAWMSRSINNGVSWSAPVQLSSGLRDAIQDSSAGNFNSDTRKGQIAITWQEDPQGLQLGEADGPGDGASGANVNGGTDVWYAHASVDLSVASTPADDFVLTTGQRLTDNWQGQYGLAGSLNPIFEGSGANADPDTVEKGNAGAARPNVAMVGSTAIVAYEETKGSEGLAEGKFVRYHAFAYATPPADAAGKAGCIISDPLKNARRVRFLTQGPAEAGAGGIQVAAFWKEGIFDKGGPSDIVLRRALGGVQPSTMVPRVDPACATSVYTEAIALTSQRAENLSSRASQLTASDDGLADDTERNSAENALAHRGVLRGGELWIGYSYTNDLVKLWAQQDNYNFWLRKYTFDPATGRGVWNLPRNLTNITDTRINVREPRIFGTPKSNPTACPSGNPDDPSTTDRTLCQNTNVLYLAWGTQENVSPFVAAGGAELGIFISASMDGGQSYFAPMRYSVAAGTLFQDDEAAFESQVVTRPDGRRYYGVWNQLTTSTGRTVAEYASGSITRVQP